VCYLLTLTLPPNSLPSQQVCDFLTMLLGCSLSYPASTLYDVTNLLRYPLIIQLPLYITSHTCSCAHSLNHLASTLCDVTKLKVFQFPDLPRIVCGLFPNSFRWRIEQNGQRILVKQVSASVFLVLVEPNSVPLQTGGIQFSAFHVLVIHLQTRLFP
jgi:hypothetical protein